MIRKNQKWVSEECELWQRFCVHQALIMLIISNVHRECNFENDNDASEQSMSNYEENAERNEVRN